MGLTTKGFIRRTYDDILNSKIQRAKELFGEDIDTSDQTPLGKFIRINAYDQALAEEAIEAVYYSRFPNTATGQSLDRLLLFGGLARNPAQPSIYTVKIEGEAGYTVAAGFLCGTDTGINFYSVADAVIGDDGTCLVTVACTEAGTLGNVNASAIVKVINPDVHISAVNGVECLSVGEDEESDVVLRERLKQAISGQGSGNTNAIRSALLRIPTVQFAAVIENETDTTDSAGRPAHSFECYVLGGDEYGQEIAKAIFEKRPIGIQTWGSEAVTITDLSGNERVVKYTRAPEIPVTVRIRIKTNTSFPDDGVNRIYTSISNYINNLGIGNSLVLSTLYGYIYSVAGVVEVTALELSTNGGASYSASNITVPQYGVAVCAAVNTEVIA